jgi:hypothetical protein
MLTYIYLHCNKTDASIPLFEGEQPPFIPEVGDNLSVVIAGEDGQPYECKYRVHQRTYDYQNRTITLYSDWMNHGEYLLRYSNQCTPMETQAMRECANA